MLMRNLKRMAGWQACMAALLAVLLTAFSVASAAHMHQPQQHAPSDQCALCVSVAQFQATCVVVAILLLLGAWEQLSAPLAVARVRPRWRPRASRIRPPPFRRS